MNFDFPWILPALIGVYWVHKYGFKSISIGYAPMAWQSYVPKLSSWKETLVRYAEILLYVCLVLGISNPSISVPRETVNVEGIDLMITLDLSASMQAADFKPNRLEAMKTLVAEYLQETRGNRTGIIVFSGKVFLHYPFSDNKYALQKAIDSIHFQSIDHNKAGGTNIGDAILFSEETLSKIKIEGREQALLLITDGENTGGVDPKISAKQALLKGIHIYIVGLAGNRPISVFDPDGDPFIGADGKQLITGLNDASLKEISNAGGGSYFRAKEGESFKSILSEIGQLEKHPLELKSVNEMYSLSLPVSTFSLLFFSIFIYFTGTYIRRPFR